MFIEHALSDVDVVMSLPDFLSLKYARSIKYRIPTRRYAILNPISQIQSLGCLPVGSRSAFPPCSQ